MPVPGKEARRKIKKGIRKNILTKKAEKEGLLMIPRKNNTIFKLI